MSTTRCPRCGYAAKAPICTKCGEAIRGAIPTLRIPPEQLIVATLQDGIADTRTIHEPSASRDNRGRIEWFTDRLARNHGIPPLEWAGVCGEAGYVYVLTEDGPFGRSVWCGVCRRVSRAAVRAGRLAA